MGSRYLKKNLLYPLVDLNKINERLDIIEELQKNYLHTSDLKKQLQEIYDLERIVGRISYGNLTPKDLLQLRVSLGVLPNIKVILSKMKGTVLKNRGEKIEDFGELHKVLFKAVDENAGFTLKDGGVIKSGYSDELDNIRNIESTNKDYLLNLELREREKTGIKTLKVGYNRVFGYYIEITKSYLDQVKDEFGYIRKQTTSNSERFITQELKEREALILRSNEMAIELEGKLFNELRETCKAHTAKLQTLALQISEIDMLISLSEVAKSNNYVRPSFSRYDEMQVIAGRHPVIEAVNNKEFVPNDLVLYNDDKILLITGPNMSGKSTFMRQNALIVIMAQIGSFVPAKDAKLPIFDQIFTRIGSSDNIMSGESTFMVEMLEVNDAIKNATERSLVIFDEVGRGTATYDGMSLAQAIIEYFHNNIGCKTLFSTHYHELTTLEETIEGIKNYSIAVKEKGENIIFLRKIVPGGTDESYGVHVAKLAGVPQVVTKRANEILKTLERKSVLGEKAQEKENKKVATGQLDLYNYKLAEIAHELDKVDLNELTPIEALNTLVNMKEKMK